MPGYNLSPLLTIPSELFQAVRTSQSYLDTATELLRDALAFDFHLATACQIRVAEGGRKDFYLECHSMDRDSAYETFLKIRGRKETVEREFPLLFHAASLLDYTAQMTVNMLPMVEKKARHYASSVSGELSFPWNHPHAVEHAIAVYLGLSPFPLFLNDFDPFSARNARLLAPYGFGVYAFLALSVIPELAVNGGIPEDILGQWRARPMLRDGIRSAPDGALTLFP